MIADLPDASHVMSGIRHDNSAQLCVLLCETIAFPKGSPKGGEKGMVCHWYITMASGKTAHLPSEVFTPKGSVQLDWCAFLVLDAGAQADVRLTVADLAGNHLCAHFGTTKNLAKSDQFDIRELKLEDVNGVVAMMTVHAASQMRWTSASAPKRELGSCDFLPADDAQALHIWKFLFPSRPPPKPQARSLKPIKEEAESEVLTPQKTQADAEEEEEEEEEGEEEEEQEEDAVEEELQESRAEEGSGREAKEREAKEREAKEREAKEREARERQAKEREAKEREAKEREAKEREAQEREAQEREAKEREAKEREAKEREAKEREAKEPEAKEREAKEQEAKARERKERDAKEMERAKDARRRSSQASQIRPRQSYLRKPSADRGFPPRGSLRVRSGEQERLGRRDSQPAPRGSLSAKAASTASTPLQVHLDRRPVDRRWLEASDSEEELHFDSEPGEGKPSSVHQASHRQHVPVPPVPSPVDTEADQKDARTVGTRRRWEHGGPKWPPRSELPLGGQEPSLHDTKSDLYAPKSPALPEEAPGFPEQLRQIQQQLHQQQVQLEEQLQLQRQLQHRWPSPFSAARARHGSPKPAQRRSSEPGPKTQIAKPMASVEASKGSPATVEGRPHSGEVEQAPKCRRLYRVTTRGLGIRAGPDVNSPRTGAVLKRGAIFEASVVAPGTDGRIYLKLSGWRGWAFDDSAVDPMDPSVEALSEQEVLDILTCSASGGTPARSHLTAKPEPSTLDPLVLPRRTEAMDDFDRKLKEERKPRGDGWSTPSGTPEADGWFLPPHRISVSPDEVLHPSISHEFREAMGLRRTPEARQL